jgi:hypothetical protein
MIFHSRYPITPPAAMHSICNFGSFKISPISASGILRWCIRTSEPASIAMVVDMRYPSYVISSIGIDSVMIRYSGISAIIWKTRVYSSGRLFVNVNRMMRNIRTVIYAIMPVFTPEIWINASESTRRMDIMIR